MRYRWEDSSICMSNVRWEGIAEDFLDLPGMNVEEEEVLPLLLLFEALEAFPPSPLVAMWNVP